MNTLGHVVLGGLLSWLTIGVIAAADDQEKAASEKTTAQIELVVGPGKTNTVTVALGQTAKEVLNRCKPAKVYADDDPWLGYAAAKGGSYVLIEPATDQAKAADVVLFDSIHDGDRYLLVFSPHDGSDAHDPKRDKLSQVMYCPGGKSESIFLLPREKRGEPIPANYRTLLENTRN